MKLNFKPLHLDNSKRFSKDQFSRKRSRLEQTLSCYIEEWMQTFKAYSVKQSTYDRLLASVKALEGFQIADMPIDEITAVHIQKYVNELAEYGYGLSTIKKQCGSSQCRSSKRQHFIRFRQMIIMQRLYRNIFILIYNRLCYSLWLCLE